jgi:hypothetical protein
MPATTCSKTEIPVEMSSQSGWSPEHEPVVNALDRVAYAFGEYELAGGTK